MRTQILTSAVAVLFLSVTVKAQQEANPMADPLAELAALGDAMADTAPEGGGSIRAKKDVDAAFTKRVRDPRNVQARVDATNTGNFPAVALQVIVMRPAREGAGKDVAKNSKLVVIPKLKTENGRIDMTDTETRINAGSFYLRRGDRVVLRLGQKKNKVWEAEYIERR